MRTATIARIARAYGLDDVIVQPPQKGYRNESYALKCTDHTYKNLILYKREQGIVDRIRRTNGVSDYAAARGLPARQCLGPITEMRAADFQKYAALYTYLPGSTIPWEGYTRTHIKLLGCALSNLHAVLEDAAKDHIPAVEEEYQHILERMERYFADSGVQKAMKQKLQLNPAVSVRRFQKLLELTKKLQYRQVLHMDFVRGNILFEGTPSRSPLILDGLAISGILDFEKTAYGPKLFDIARTLAFLLVDCKFKSEDKVRRYFLHSGYQKRGASPLPNLAPLEDLVNMFLLHDFYKFLCHNPYESLGQNEHYLRTRDLLLRRKVLRT